MLQKKTDNNRTIYYIFKNRTRKPNRSQCVSEKYFIPNKVTLIPNKSSEANAMCKTIARAQL